MHRLSIAVIGEDRPGMVAAVTGVLFAQGCNLADCSMSRLSGQFAMIMLLDAPVTLTEAELARALEPVGTEMGLAIMVQVAPDSGDGPPRRPYVVSLFGADHPGIVYRIASELAARRVNVTDLVSRIAGTVYIVVMDVDLPPGLEESDLERDLNAAAGELGVDLVFRPADVDTL